MKGKAVDRIQVRESAASIQTVGLTHEVRHRLGAGRGTVLGGASGRVGGPRLILSPERRFVSVSGATDNPLCDNQQGDDCGHI